MFLVFGIISFALGLSHTSEPINFFMVDGVSNYVIERYKSIERHVLNGTASFIVSLLSYAGALYLVVVSFP